MPGLNAVGNLPVAERRMSAEDKWKLLFSTFLNIPVHELDLTIKVDQDKIQLTTPHKSIVEKIQAVLNEPSVNYILTEKSKKEAPVKAGPIPPMLILRKGTGENVYEQLFGKSVLKRMGYIDWKKEVDRDDCFVLQGECSGEFQGLDEPQIANCKEILSSASFEELRNALTSDPRLYSPLPNRRTKNGILAPHIDKILYRSNDGTKVFFDFGLLVNCLSAPFMQITEVANNAAAQPLYQLQINKTHLINYFCVVFQEGFVLNLSGDPNAPQQNATPILFSMKRAIALRNVVTLVLDCSGSMSGDREAYLEHVKEFLRQLSTEPDYQDAVIRVVLFASYYHATEFKLSDLNTILSYVDRIYINGGTWLNNAMHAELSHLLTNAKANENVTVVAFTDGGDTGDYEHEVSLKGTVADISRKQGFRPRIFTMGLGASYEAAKLTALAALTGGTSIHLTTINDFKMIMDHLGEMSSIKEFISFVQNDLTQFVTPSYANDLSVAGGSLVVPGSFSVGNREYQVERRAPLAPQDGRAAQQQQPPQQQQQQPDPTQTLLELLTRMTNQAKGDLLLQLLKDQAPASQQLAPQQQAPQQQAAAELDPLAPLTPKGADDDVVELTFSFKPQSDELDIAIAPRAHGIFKPAEAEANSSAKVAHDQQRAML